MFCLFVRMDRSVRLVSVAALCFLPPSAGLTATLAGQTVKPGGTLDLRFPVPKFFQDYASPGGNPRPTTGRAVVPLPQRFDPARPWPTPIVRLTTEPNTTR